MIPDRYLPVRELTHSNAGELAMQSYYITEQELLNAINSIHAVHGIEARIFVFEPSYGQIHHEQDVQGPEEAPAEGGGNEGGGDRASEEEQPPRTKGRRKKTAEGKSP